jgi:hypothetical protein
MTGPHLMLALGAAMLVAAPAAAQMGRGSATDYERAARGADGAALPREAATLLREAERAAGAGNWRLANELVERAETSLLNRHAGIGGAEAARTGPALGAVAEARRAVSMRDRGMAMEALRTAQAESSRMEQPLAAAPGADPARGMPGAPGAMGAPGAPDMTGAPGAMPPAGGGGAAGTAGAAGAAGTGMGMGMSPPPVGGAPPTWR